MLQLRPSRVKQINTYFLKRKIEQSQRGERRQVIDDKVHQQERLESVVFNEVMKERLKVRILEFDTDMEKAFA